jgi:hypothetical protein
VKRGRGEKKRQSRSKKGGGHEEVGERNKHILPVLYCTVLYCNNKNKNRNNQSVSIHEEEETTQSATFQIRCPSRC